MRLRSSFDVERIFVCRVYACIANCIDTSSSSVVTNAQVYATYLLCCVVCWMYLQRCQLGVFVCHNRVCWHFLSFSIYLAVRCNVIIGVHRCFLPNRLRKRYRRGNPRLQKTGSCNMFCVFWTYFVTFFDITPVKLLNLIVKKSIIWYNKLNKEHLQDFLAYSTRYK